MHFPGVVCVFVFLGLVVRTHRSAMTTSGNKGDSSKRSALRRGLLRRDGSCGAPAGGPVDNAKAANAAQRGHRSDSRQAGLLLW